MRLLWTEANGSDITKWEKGKWLFQKCHILILSVMERLSWFGPKVTSSAVCLSTSQQVIRWASAWLTSRKLRPLHLMTSLSSWYDLLILWPVKCEWLSYRVRHGNTILRWLIILKQKNLKRKSCEYFHFASFIFSSCLLVKRGISLDFVYKFSAPKWFNCNVRYCGGRKLQHLINKYYLRGGVCFLYNTWLICKF